MAKSKKTKEIEPTNKDMPDVSITDVKTDDSKIDSAKKKYKQLRKSNFYITINTNKRFNPHSLEVKEFKKKFKKCCDELLGPSKIPELFKIKEEGKQFNRENIKGIKITKVIEIGGTTHCVHLHAIIQVSHYVNIHLNYEEIIKFVKEKMNLPNIYFNNRVWRDNGQNLEEYLKKTSKTNEDTGDTDTEDEEDDEISA